jgi:hypothetical protein
MSLLSAFRRVFSGFVCPLCGGKKTYEVRGGVNYFELEEELVQRKKWMEVHGLTTAIPRPPDIPGIEERLRAMQHPPVKSRDGVGSDGEVHHRCSTCDTLLPPQFNADVSVSRDFAITVAGLVGHGKTSWLLAILSTADGGEFEIVRLTPRLMTKRYPYAEPYTVDILETGFRSAMYYQLFGTTLVFDRELTFIRTLDIKGEMFEGTYATRTEDTITRHLESGEGEGWLLVIDQFGRVQAAQARTDTQKIKNIGRAYEEIRATMASRGGTERIRHAVVWTFLDQAQWSDAGAQWLRDNVKNFADDLIAIGSTQLTPVDGVARHVSFVDNLAALDEWIMALINNAPFDVAAHDALVALMFRLQILYTVRARRARSSEGPITKFSYYEQAGYRFVNRIQGIAKLLYGADSRSAVPDFAKGDECTVFPCGRLEGKSVWSDQILLHAVEPEK